MLTNVSQHRKPASVFTLLIPAFREQLLQMDGAL
jgi:hypothetical protein